MPPAQITAHDALLLETIARHFPNAQIRDGEIELGFGDIRMAGRVNTVREIGAYKAANLFFHLWGGHIGSSPVFASVSGYGESPEVAIVGGACNWACAFGPVLRAGLAEEVTPDLQAFEVTVGGQAFRVFVDGLDRAMSTVGEDATPRLAAARARFAPDSWLARVVLQSGVLPFLASERPTILSVFVSDAPGKRVVEVKVDGVDWPGADEAFANVGPEPAGAVTMLRELAVAVPAGPAPPLARGPIERTLRRLSDQAPQRSAIDWPGWKHHGGTMAAPLPSETLRDLEKKIGELPSDYRDFLAAVGGAGAAPGYGLLSPMNHAHLARGTFAWVDGEQPNQPARGVLPLAHAGCGVMWLLVLAGPHRGEVWVDARSSDGRVRRVATSFGAWYRDWLASAVRDAAPWLQWDAACCATPHVLSQVIQQLECEGVSREAVRVELAKRLKPGSMALASGGSEYFAAQTPLNPCHGCVALAARFGLESNLFQRA